MQTRKAFTLVEVMVTVAIIAILATLGVTNYSRAIRNGRDARRKSDISNLQQALVMYRYEQGTYPATRSYSSMIGALMPSSGTKYLTQAPVSVAGIDYTYSGSATEFTVCSAMEINTNGNSKDNSATPCSSAGASDCTFYCLRNP